VIGLTGLAILAGLLAYANGANDVSKGIATLVGSGVTSYRRAMLWGAAWTGLGAAAATTVAGAMLATFGSGLLGPGVTPTFAASLAAIGGATAWVLLANRTGLPVSTTHAIIGAVVGAAVAAYGAQGIAWSGLLGGVVLPLAVSPIVAVGVAYLGSRALRAVPAPTAGASDCLCVSASPALVVDVIPTGAAALRSGPGLDVTVHAGDTSSCAIDTAGVARITGDHAHWLSSGAVSFARGLNDAPKIVALALGAAVLAPESPGGNPALLFALVSVAMLTGSVLGGRRVTRRLAEGITPMSHREGLVANVVAAVLVTGGAVYGLPMSTTHVASGGIIGIGVVRRSLDGGTVRAMVLAWVVTVPVAALFGAAAFTMMDRLLA
jgi:PiT family inorganic phosphate transporter